MEDAYNWYERARTGLGEEFLAAVREGLDAALAHPEQFPLVHRRVRRALLRRFPYSLLERVEPEAILLVAVFHAKRDPRVWRARE
ncbi:MAG: type II toxin-antitoxin system RelE/ParE family toxin [Desulfobacterales bacterium]|nr:type II toxin-antitoxin system RelE/ParE family toxin [Desulfobacterales bacterium]